MKPNTGSLFNRWHSRRFGKVVGQMLSKGLSRRTAIERAGERAPKLAKRQKLVPQ